MSMDWFEVNKSTWNTAKNNVTSDINDHILKVKPMITRCIEERQSDKELHAKKKKELFCKDTGHKMEYN